MDSISIQYSFYVQISFLLELIAIIERQIASGDYHSPDEVIAAALLRLEDLNLDLETDAENERRWQKFQQTGQSVSHATVGDWVNQLGTANREKRDLI
jgi:Arc/MetJ-type ribon-helix-helix transcriptional regulator